MFGKSMFASKTMWVNAIMAALLLVNQATDAGVIPEDAMPYVVIGVNVANMVLRLLTSKPITSM